MAKFRIYNIQLLPNTTAHEDVGIFGYKKVFATFREITKAAYRARTLSSYHVDAGAKNFFGPQEFHVGAGYVWGYFVKYKNTEKVENVYTRESLKKSKQLVSGIKDMLFIFDCDQHFLAIEEASGALPNDEALIPILADYLTPIVANHYPDHQLHILLVADKKSLDQIFSKAVAFGNIKVDMTFPNGDAEDTLDAMKKARIHRFQFTATPAVRGQIDRHLPTFISDLMTAGMTYGKIMATYYTHDKNKTGVEVRNTYNSDADPLTFEKHQGREEDDTSFVTRCLDELKKIVKINNLLRPSKISPPPQSE